MKKWGRPQRWISNRLWQLLRQTPLQPTNHEYISHISHMPNKESLNLKYPYPQRIDKNSISYSCGIRYPLRPFCALGFTSLAACPTLGTPLVSLQLCVLGGRSKYWNGMGQTKIRSPILVEHKPLKLEWIRWFWMVHAQILTHTAPTAHTIP